MRSGSEAILTDVIPIRPGYGQIYQGSALFDADRIPEPRLVVVLFSPLEPCATGTLSLLLEDNEQAIFPDKTLLAICDALAMFVMRGHSIFLNSIRGQHRPTYLNVGLHTRLGMVYEDAYALVRQRHAIAKLRNGTARQLLRLESHLNTRLIR